MRPHKPPANDAERLANVLEGLASLDDEGPTDDEIRAEAEAGGIDLAAWAAEIKAKAEAPTPPLAPPFDRIANGESQ